MRLKGNKAVNNEGVNYDGNMDRGAMTFTSDVSLPKDGKQLCCVTNYSWAIDRIINAPQC